MNDPNSSSRLEIDQSFKEIDGLYNPAARLAITAELRCKVLRALEGKTVKLSWADSDMWCWPIMIHQLRIWSASSRLGRTFQWRSLLDDRTHMLIRLARRNECST